MQSHHTGDDNQMFYPASTAARKHTAATVRSEELKIAIFFDTSRTAEKKSYERQVNN